MYPGVAVGCVHKRSLEGWQTKLHTMAAFMWPLGVVSEGSGLGLAPFIQMELLSRACVLVCLPRQGQGHHCFRLEGGLDSKCSLCLGFHSCVSWSSSKRLNGHRGVKVCCCCEKYYTLWK